MPTAGSNNHPMFAPLKNLRQRNQPNKNEKMSGGHFEYQQYRIEDIAVEIDEMIGSNDDQSLDEWGQRRGNNYPPEILEKFREAAHTLRQAAEMAQRVDWLVSGDDGEDSFIRRWGKEVRPYWHNAIAHTPATNEH